MIVEPWLIRIIVLSSWHHIWHFIGSHWCLLNFTESYQVCTRGTYYMVAGHRLGVRFQAPECQLLIMWFRGLHSLWILVSSSMTLYLIMSQCLAHTGHKTKSMFLFFSLSLSMLIFKVTLGNEYLSKHRHSSNPEPPVFQVFLVIC